MATIVIPSGRIYKAMNSSAESFFFEFDPSGTLLLMLRLFPSLAASVANGAPLSLHFANPHASPHRVTLRINDISDVPRQLTQTFSTDTGDPISDDPPGLSDYIHHLAAGKPLRLAIFDALIRCVYAADLTYKAPTQSVQRWHGGLAPLPADSRTVPGCDLSYSIELDPLTPLDRDATPWVIDLDAEINWGPEPYTTAFQQTSRHFTATDYLREGAVGRWQEQALRELLTQHFTPGVQLFFNPKIPAGQELTDIAATVPGVVVLFESKCPASFEGGKPLLRSKRRATTTRAIEACEQLAAANVIVRTKPETYSRRPLRSIAARPLKSSRYALSPTRP